MNAHSDGERRTSRLVDIIDLKWLLASQGVHLHVERLQADPAYAAALLAPALISANAALRSAAERVHQHLAPAAG